MSFSQLSSMTEDETHLIRQPSIPTTIPEEHDEEEDEEEEEEEQQGSQHFDTTLQFAPVDTSALTLLKPLDSNGPEDFEETTSSIQKVSSFDTEDNVPLATLAERNVDQNSFHSYTEDPDKIEVVED
jgi:hypothetical protein